MALTAGKIFLNITLADEAGNRAQMRHQLDYADLATAVTDLATIQSIITDLIAITNAAVVTYSIGQEWQETVDANRYGASSSQVEELALITSKLEDPSKYTNLRIPAPAVGVFLAGPGPDVNVVDVSNAALQTYLTHFGPAGQIFVSDGERIAAPSGTGNFKGKRIHRGSRNG